MNCQVGAEDAGAVLNAVRTGTCGTHTVDRRRFTRQRKRGRGEARSAVRAGEERASGLHLARAPTLAPPPSPLSFPLLVCLPFARTLTSSFRVYLFLQVGAAVAIIIVVATKLSNIAVNLDILDLGVSYECLLGLYYKSATLCRYTYVACGISLGVSIGTGLLQVVSLNCCGVGSLADLAVGFGAGIWWMVTAAIINTRAKNIDDGLDLQSWRNLVIALCWSECALFFLVALTAVLSFCI